MIYAFYYQLKFPSPGEVLPYLQSNNPTEVSFFLLFGVTKLQQKLNNISPAGKESKLTNKRVVVVEKRMIKFKDYYKHYPRPNS
jgi:hypothetical protein